LSSFLSPNLQGIQVKARTLKPTTLNKITTPIMAIKTHPEVVEDIKRTLVTEEANSNKNKTIKKTSLIILKEGTTKGIKTALIPNKTLSPVLTLAIPNKIEAKAKEAIKTSATTITEDMTNNMEKSKLVTLKNTEAIEAKVVIKANAIIIIEEATTNNMEKNNLEILKNSKVIEVEEAAQEAAVVVKEEAREVVKEAAKEADIEVAEILNKDHKKDTKKKR